MCYTFRERPGDYMITVLGKILIDVIVIVIVATLVVIGYQEFSKQQAEITALQNRPALVVTRVATVSATEAPTATPAATSVLLVRPTVAVAVPTK